MKNLKFYDHGQKSCAKSAQVVYEIKNKNVSHIVIRQNAVTNLTASLFRVKVEINSNNFQGVIVDDFLNTVLEKFSDNEFGHPTQSTTSKKAVINIGSQRLQQNESIVVTITDLSTGTHTTSTFDLMTIYANETADFLHVYHKTTIDQNVLSDVNAVVLDSSSLIATDSMDITVNGSGGIVSKPNLEMLDDMLANNILSEDGFLSVLYDHTFTPNVYAYEYKGTNTFAFYYRRVLANPERTLTSSIEVLSDAQRIYSRISKTNPDVVNSFVHSGRIPSPEAFESRIDQLSSAVPDYKPNFQKGVSLLSEV